MWRVRDLSKTSRWAVLGLGLLLALPYVAAVVRARANGWLPSGDAGLAALFARDNRGGHPMLVGPSATANLFSGRSTHHPGPIEYYALVVPTWLLGSSLGLLVWTALVNASAVLVSAWVVFRRTGPRVGLIGAVVLAGVAWSQGPAQLVEPINSDSGAIPLLAVAVLAWAVADGDRRLLPLFALWFAYFTQLHLGYLPYGLGILGLLTLALVVPAVVRPVLARRHRAAEDGETVGRRARAAGAPRRTLGAELDDDDLFFVADDDAAASVTTADEETPPYPTGRWWPWLLGALGVSVATWLPVLIDTVTNDPSNARAVWDYSRLDGRETIGFGKGAALAAKALSPVPFLFRTNQDPADYVRSVDGLGWVGAGVVVLLLLAVAWRRWRSDRPLAVLALVTLAFSAIGVAVAAQVPVLYELRLGNYRWAFVTSALACITLVGTAAGLIRERTAEVVDPAMADPDAEVVVEVELDADGEVWAERTLGPKPRRSLRPVGFALAAVLALGSTFVAGPAEGREDVVFAMERSVDEQVLKAVDGYDRVLIVPLGTLAARSLAMPLAVSLEDHGHRAVFPAYEADQYRPHRALANVEPDVVVLLASGLGPIAALPGQEIAAFGLNPDRDAVVATLVAQIGATPTVIAPNGDAIAAQAGLDPFQIRQYMSGFSGAPARYLQDPTARYLLQAGYLSTPIVDRNVLATMPPVAVNQLWGEDHVQVRILSVAGFRKAYPEMD